MIFDTVKVHFLKLGIRCKWCVHACHLFPVSGRPQMKTLFVFQPLWETLTSRDALRQKTENPFWKKVSFIIAFPDPPLKKEFFSPHDDRFAVSWASGPTERSLIKLSFPQIWKESTNDELIRGLSHCAARLNWEGKSRALSSFMIYLLAVSVDPGL